MLLLCYSFAQSARIVHSRAKPLQGKAYANFFAHYRPVVPVASTLKWYEQDNSPHSHSTTPLIDLGECVDRGRGKGFVCDGMELPHLVSTTPVVTSLTQMIQFWELFNDVEFSDSDSDSASDSASEGAETQHHTSGHSEL